MRLLLSNGLLMLNAPSARFCKEYKPLSRFVQRRRMHLKSLRRRLVTALQSDRTNPSPAALQMTASRRRNSRIGEGERLDQPKEQMNNTARPADRKISPSAALFKKVLQAFANGDLPYSDVQSHLERLLNSDAPPEELRDVLQRYESIEPLPAYAHAEVLRVLNEAMVRAAASNVDSGPAPGQPQDSQSAPTSI